MRLKSVVLASSSFATLALLATPAAAQPAQEQPPETAEAQEAPTDTEANEQTGTDAAEGEAIVVTGLRQSLRSSQNIKRNSEQIVDAIVAEDIGKLPDIAVSDTAARIPGVQVERSGGEAGRVLVRGLPDYTTTYNSREIFTAETRVVALQDFPSGAIGAIEVFKTSSANLVEPGLAGLVNVRSRRPFDFRGFEVAGSAWVLFPRQSGEATPNGNFLITNRWDAGDGEIGALLNFSYTSIHYQDSIVSNAYFVAPGPNGGRVPDWPFIEYNEAHRARPSINGAIQYRPRPGVEFYVEGLWQGFRHKIQDRHFEVPIWGGRSYTNIVQRDGNLIESGTVTNPFRGQGWQGGTYNTTNTYQFAVGGSYDLGSLRISGDVARTDSTFTGSTASVDYVLPFVCEQTGPRPQDCIERGQYVVDFFIGRPGGGAGPQFDIRGFDTGNPANFLYRGFYEQAQEATGDDLQARLDFVWEPGFSFLRDIQWGMRFVNRDAHREFGDRYSTRGFGTPIGQIPLDYQLFRPGFRGTDQQPTLRTWLAPTYRSIRDGLGQLRTIAGFPEGPPPPNPNTVFDANEKTYAAYGQLNYEFGSAGGMVVDGQIGLRAVRSELSLQGTQLGLGGTPQAVNIERGFTDWLPNASMRLQFQPGLQLRLAASQTRTRPPFGDLNPTLTFGNPPSCATNPQPGTICERTASGGNPFLTPLTSNNYDASLEYYFARTGFASVAVFQRDLRGFITPSAYQFPTPDPQTGLPLRVSGPINSGRGRIKGFEAQISTFFDFDGVPEFLQAFGFQANVTHLDASAQYPNFQNADDLVDRPLIGISRWSYNLVGMYERGPVTMRLAYNHRSSFRPGLGLNAYDERRDFSSGDQPYVLQRIVRGVGRLDLSASFAVNDNLTVFTDWTNILSDPTEEDLVRIDPSGARFDPNGPQVRFPFSTRYEERILSIGARFRF